MTQRALLICGVIAPMLYALADLIAGLQTPGYSFRDQTISELGAIGAPSRPLFSALLIVVYALFAAFGIGVWRSAGRSRGLRAVGGLVLTEGVMALAVGQFASMEMRGADQGLAGSLHLIEGAVAMVLITAAMVIGAVTLSGRFRVYTVLAIVVMLGFGFWSTAEVPAVGAGVITPWLGVKERIFWYDYWCWFAALAVFLLRCGSPELRDRS